MQASTRQTLRTFWLHSKRYRFLIFAMLLSMLLVMASELVMPFFYKSFFDILTEEMSDVTSVGRLKKILMAIVGLGLFNWLMQRARHFAVAYFEVRTMRDLYNSSFEYLHKHSHRFFTDNFAGSLVKKVGRFVRSFEGYVDRLYFDLLPLGIKITFIFSILFWLDSLIGLIVLGWSLIFIVSTLVLTRYKWKYDVARAKMDTKVTGLLADTITNNPNLKFFATMKYEMKRFAQTMERWANTTVREWNVGQYSDAFQGFMVILLEFLVLYVAVQGWSRGELSVGDFVLLQAYLFDIFRTIWSFGRTIRDLYRNLADAEEMTEVLSLEHEVQDKKGAKKISITRGKIEFEKVCFSYASNETEVVHGLSFKIKSGEKVALVGLSGGGKSTVTKLILRLFDIQKGRILVDGQDISKVTQESLRSQISLVPQDPILFHRTLMENIRYGRLEASDQEVMAAAKLANCHEFIERLPEKYGTYVGERGIKLSGGERQRVAIARAILSNAPILILDEATSSLDSASETLIQEALQNLIKHKTTLVIAHRLSTITEMDRILVFQDGKIVEDGVHAELINYKTGLYKKLWELQVGGYIDR